MTRVLVFFFSLALDPVNLYRQRAVQSYPIFVASDTIVGAGVLLVGEISLQRTMSLNMVHGADNPCALPTPPDDPRFHAVKSSGQR